MALTNCYCTLAELQARMSIGDTVDDVILEQVITGVSRMIDAHTRRRFYAATETRYYTALRTDWLEVDDLLSVTTFATDNDGTRAWSTTWATTDYELLPANASADGLPYTMIELAYNGRYSFPLLTRGVKIVGSFGYASATPDMIREACLLQGARIFKRKDSPFGVAGVGELGVMRISQLDPDVKQLLQQYIRHGFGGRS